MTTPDELRDIAGSLGRINQQRALDAATSALTWEIEWRYVTPATDAPTRPVAGSMDFPEPWTAATRRAEYRVLIGAIPVTILLDRSTCWSVGGYRVGHAFGDFYLFLDEALLAIADLIDAQGADAENHDGS